MRKTIPVAQRVLGENNELMLLVRWNHARAIYDDPGATLDDIREAVAMLEDSARTARRVLGGANPIASAMEDDLRRARIVLAIREALSP